MSKRKAETVEATEATPTLDQAIDSLKKINNDFTESIKSLSGTVDGVMKHYEDLQKQYDDLRKDLDHLAKTIGELSGKAKALEKQVGEKFGYIEMKKEGMVVYDRIGGKVLGGPFLLPAKKEPAAAEIVQAEKEPEEEKPIPLSGTSRTDQNGRMYVYVDTKTEDYEVVLDSKEPLSIARKTDAFFIVEGKPGTEFKWEVKE